MSRRLTVHRLSHFEIRLDKKSEFNITRKKLIKINLKKYKIKKCLRVTKCIFNKII